MSIKVGSGSIGTAEQSGADPVGSVVDVGKDGGGNRGGGGNPITIDPTTLGSGGNGTDSGNNNPDGTVKKRRGRKPGSGASGGKKSAALDVNGVSATLYSLHMMTSGMLSTPELKLEEGEAKMMAEAIANVSRHYDVGVSQKSIDWMNLFGAMGMIYGTRIFTLRTRKAAERAERRNQPQPGVTAEGVVIPGNFGGTFGGPN